MWALTHVNKTELNWHHRENIKEIFQLCAANISVAVLFLYIGKYSISTVSSCYNGAGEGFWQAHYRIPSPIPPHPPLKYLFSLPDRPVSIRYQKLWPLPAEYFR